MINFAEIISVCTDVINKASSVVLEFYNRPLATVDYKADHSPLTQADLRSNEIICQGLAQHFQWPILSEETQDNGLRQNSAFVWLVDPLDGTKEFLAKNGEFTINIALIENNKPIFGMIAVPVLGHIYYAAEGQGAYLKMRGKRIRLMCSQNTRPEQARLSVSRSHLDSLLKNRLECSKFQNFIPMGSALKYARIAQGEAEGSLRGTPLMEWDIGAADCIVREAGGCITDFQGNDLQYNKKNPIHNDGIIASNRLLHAFFINWVQPA